MTGPHRLPTTPEEAGRRVALDLFLETRRLLDALDEAGVEHAVAGAIAR